MLKKKPIGPSDNLDWCCERLVLQLKKTYRGHKAEISARELVKAVKQFSVHYGLKENELLHAALKGGWLEPIGSDTYAIHYDMVRK